MSRSIAANTMLSPQEIGLLKKELRKVALETGRPIGELVVEALADYLGVSREEALAMIRAQKGDGKGGGPRRLQ